MDIHLPAQDNRRISGTITITGSKSESNRLLLLRALYPQLRLENVSNADDARVMATGLSAEKGNVDIHHAGTAMRFLTAYFANRPGAEVVLTGSARMKQRPIGILVDALRRMGADIEYTAVEGYPPLAIRGRSLDAGRVSLPADVSSQYISALLLIAPSMADGLVVELEGKVTSVPYIEMTLGLLRRIGVEATFDGRTVAVRPGQTIGAKTLTVESDWSAASYYYSLMALAEPGSRLTLAHFRNDSLQGDRVLAELYRAFGVSSRFEDTVLHLEQEGSPYGGERAAPPVFEADLSNAPDIAQTIAVTCFGLGRACRLTGLHTLPIKETDRLEAMRKELGKFGAEVHVTKDSLLLESAHDIRSGVTVDTYDDHRMAMAFAPLTLRTALTVRDASVVSKSYPDFWSDLHSLGIEMT